MVLGKKQCEQQIDTKQYPHIPVVLYSVTVNGLLIHVFANSNCIRHVCVCVIGEKHCVYKIGKKNNMKKYRQNVQR